MSSSKALVRVRFAPSPTGPFHVGSARTALFNWLFARQNKGTFILRIEDTDKERSKREHEEEIFASLGWLGMTWDEGPDKEGDYGPYRQSERGEIYRGYLEQLLEDRHAYYCYCTKEELEAQRQSVISQGLAPIYNGHCKSLSIPPKGREPQVIRFKTPEKTVTFKDLVRKTVSFESNLIGDFAIAKDTKTPFYNFAVVVDDGEMRVSHVIRGEDHLSNTPKQILIQEALGFQEPIYIHLPLILAPDKSKLSKRYIETSFLAYRERGYMPTALMNFMALLGWHPEGDRELFMPEELIKAFDITRVQKSGAVFNGEKLEWMNKEHLKLLSAEEIMASLLPLMRERGVSMDEQMLMNIIEAERGRMRTLKDFLEMTDFFLELPDYAPKLLLWNDETPENTRDVLEEVRDALVYMSPEVFTREVLSRGLQDLIDTKGKGSVLWPLRVALSGKQASPDPFAIATILGKEETERRVKIAIEKLS